jgi:hypothetical protein
MYLQEKKVNTKKQKYKKKNKNRDNLITTKSVMSINL